MKVSSTRTALLLGIALFGLGSVGVALWTQHGLGMEPCPWCILQRLIIVLIVLVALLVCLIPTTIGALLSAIGIAGMDRLVQRNVLAMSGRAVDPRSFTHGTSAQRVRWFKIGHQQGTLAACDTLTATQL